MKLKNIEVEPLANFLMKFELKGKESRLRTKFVRLLTEVQQQINKDNYELIKEYANLDEDKEPKKVERDGKFFYDIKPELKREYNKEYIVLMEEDYIVDETENNKEMLSFIKEAILNCEMTFKGREAIEYDRYCDIVEEINYEN